MAFATVGQASIHRKIFLRHAARREASASGRAPDSNRGQVPAKALTVLAAAAIGLAATK